MQMENPTEGFMYYGPGTCIECGGQLAVIDSEFTVMNLDQEGTPIDIETIVKVKGACTRCGIAYKMMRWKGGYIPYDEQSYLLKRYNARCEIEDRVKQNKAIQNPFLING